MRLPKIFNYIFLFVSTQLAFADYTVVQSSEQALYYFDSASLDGTQLESGDWLVARNGDILVGAEQWSGINTEVVIMGEEQFDLDGWSCNSGPVNTCGMMLPGQTPQFYIYDTSASIEIIANYTAADGFAASTEWTVAELLPSTTVDVNKIFSMQLKLERKTSTTVPVGFAINDISLIYRPKPITNAIVVSLET